MPSVATQTALQDIPAAASFGSPRSPTPSSMDWRLLQPPSWVGISTRRSGMGKKPYMWHLKHSFSQTDGGMYNAAAWEFISDPSGYHTTGKVASTCDDASSHEVMSPT